MHTEPKRTGVAILISDRADLDKLSQLRQKKKSLNTVKGNNPFPKGFNNFKYICTKSQCT